MGKVSVEVKERYNAKTYDRATVRFYKGELEKIKEYAESIGKSFNGYINDLIVSDMERNGVELRNPLADEQTTAADAEPTAE